MRLGAVSWEAFEVVTFKPMSGEGDWINQKQLEKQSRGEISLGEDLEVGKSVVKFKYLEAGRGVEQTKQRVTKTYR